MSTNAQGIVQIPNADLTQQLVNINIASYDARANLKLFRAQDEMMQRRNASIHKPMALPLHRCSARDTVLYSDGGSKRAPALNPIHSADRILRLIAGTLNKSPMPATVVARLAMGNGLQGLVMRSMPTAINTCI